MKRFPARAARAAVFLGCTLVAGAALADKPAWAGGGKAGKHEGERRDRGEQAGTGASVQFGARDRQIIVEYYRGQAAAGHCPPGLAKKTHGCLPPGRARKWTRGRPLPAGIEYHELPPELVVRLPAPPSGHRYVQVAADILLIAVGTGMVVDAVEDLMR